jgi:hypothetical protein
LFIPGAAAVCHFPTFCPLTFSSKIVTRVTRLTPVTLVTLKWIFVGKMTHCVLCRRNSCHFVQSRPSLGHKMDGQVREAEVVETFSSFAIPIVKFEELTGICRRQFQLF